MAVFHLLNGTWKMQNNKKSRTIWSISSCAILSTLGQGRLTSLFIAVIHTLLVAGQGRLSQSPVQEYSATAGCFMGILRQMNILLFRQYSPFEQYMPCYAQTWQISALEVAWKEFEWRTNLSFLFSRYLSFRWQIKWLGMFLKNAIKCARTTNQCKKKEKLQSSVKYN